MTTTERNPDIDIHKDEIPPGCYIHEGKNLMLSVRGKIPFGLATYKIKRDNHAYQTVTHGLVIRESDRERMDALMTKKEAALIARGGTRA